MTRAHPARRPERRLGVGVLGCAEIARRRFLPAAVRCSEARLVAVASRDRDLASAVAAPLGCEARDYRGLLRSNDVDLVYVPLPNHLHEEWVVAALEHGKHVLCEKPLGLSAASVERMLDAAERSGRLLFENLAYLQHPQHPMVAELVAAGAIGAVTGLHCTFQFPTPPPGNYRIDPSRGGGAFHDLNRYPLSAAHLFLGGDIAEITRCVAEWRDGLDVSMEAEASTTAGQRLSFSIAFGKPYESFYELRGTEGTLRLERAFTPPADHRCRLDLRGACRAETLSMPAHDQFERTIDHVVGRIASGDWSAVEHERSRWLARSALRFLAANRGEVI